MNAKEREEAFQRGRLRRLAKIKAEKEDRIKKGRKLGQKRSLEVRRKKIKDGDYSTVYVDKKPKVRKVSRVDYDFLKYIRMVFRWALENNPELKRNDIEMLLYLYPIGAFSMSQFSAFHKTMGLYSIKTMSKFMKAGYIEVWRERRGNEKKLYHLTQKAKVMCAKMHKFSCGDAEIPLNPMVNEMAKRDKPRINNYYLEMIKKMNKESHKRNKEG